LTAIGKGELLVVWSGTLVDRSELETLPPAVRKHSLQVEEDHYLVSLTDCEPADYVNHSCAPNTGLSGQITLVALRDIAAGEEITYDYAMSDGSSYDEFACDCGAPECRHRVTGEDWRRLSLWDRYDRHFSPYLQRRAAQPGQRMIEDRPEHATLSGYANGLARTARSAPPRARRKPRATPAPI
jgi:hypothetical protein